VSYCLVCFFYCLRWDKLEEGIKEQQKRQDAQSLQWSSYQETLQQTLAWLDAMEKTLQQDPAAFWSSTQEIRSKLLKHKVTDIVLHSITLNKMTEL
jgi:nesprin-1